MTRLHITKKYMANNYQRDLGEQKIPKSSNLIEFRATSNLSISKIGVEIVESVRISNLEGGDPSGTSTLLLQSVIFIVTILGHSWVGLEGCARPLYVIVHGFVEHSTI